MDPIEEQIKKEMADLKAYIDSLKGQVDATTDPAKLEAAVVAMVDKQVAARLAAHEAAKPRRKGELIGPPGFQVANRGYLDSGKFAGLSIDEAVFVRNLMRKLHAQESKVPGPSKELVEVVDKALSATGSTAGDEWVPTGMAAQIWEDTFVSARVVGAIGRFPMPSDPYDSPIITVGTWRKGTSNTAGTASDPTTGKSTLTSTEQVMDFSWSYDLSEDSVVAELPAFRQMLAQSGGEQMDAFVLNADSTDANTGNINLDDANPDDDSYYLSAGQDGIRHLYIVDNTGQSTDINSTLEDSELRAGIGRLGKYAVNVNNVLMVPNVKTYVLSMLSLTNVVTVDKYGPQAPILTGELAKYGGIAVIPSSQLLLAEDDGKQSTTGSNNDEGQIALFDRTQWRVGFRRDLLIEVDKDIQKRSFIMVASFRIAVGCRGTRSTATHTAGVHGITYS